jgi:hypothetical protein
MRRNALVFAFAGVAIAVVAHSDSPTHLTTTAQTTANMTQTPVAAGYIVHLDGNGKMVTGPQAVSDARFNAELEKSMNTSSEGLTQETLPGGIVKVNLQGRFATTMVATKDANGKVVVPCLTNENDVKAFEKTSAAPTAARKE